MKKTASVMLITLITTIGMLGGCKKDDPIVSSDIRDKFVGSYEVQEGIIENSTERHISYTLGISKSTTHENRIILSNIVGSGQSAYAVVGMVITGTPSEYAFIISEQTIVINGVNYTIYGPGAIDGRVLNFSTSLSSPGLPNRYTTDRGTKK